MSTIGRSFNFTQTFFDLSKMENSEYKFGDWENHYGINWKIAIRCSDNHLGVCLLCHPKEEDGSTIQAQVKVEIISLEGKLFHKEGNHDFTQESYSYRFLEFIDWSELSEKYLKNDQLEVKWHVTIIGATGIKKEALRRFDKSMERFSDMILKVGGQDFYVSKLTLAIYSPYFEGLFLGGFEESKKSTVELKDMDPEDFQDYLELIYSCSPISDWNVERLLELADMYDTPLIMQKCEEYLMSGSSTKLSRKDKLRQASQFHLEKLANFCIDQFTFLERSTSIFKRF